jgi:hypothetical protein
MPVGGRFFVPQQSFPIHEPPRWHNIFFGGFIGGTGFSIDVGCPKLGKKIEIFLDDV